MNKSISKFAIRQEFSKKEITSTHKKNPYTKDFFYAWQDWKIRVLNELFKEDNLFRVIQPGNKHLMKVGGVSERSIQEFTNELSQWKILRKIQRYDATLDDTYKNRTNQYVISPVFHIDSVRASLSSIFESFLYFSIKLIISEYYCTHYNTKVSNIWAAWTQRKGKAQACPPPASFLAKNGGEQNPQTGNAAAAQDGNAHLAERSSLEAVQVDQSSWSSSLLRGVKPIDLELDRIFGLLSNNQYQSTKKELLDEYHFYGGTT